MTASEAAVRTVAVLGFHKIGAPPPGARPTWNYVSEDVFAGYLEFLRDEGFVVLGHAAFEAALDEPESLPERAAMLTFDDGYRSMLRVAEPILAGFGYPSVLFVPTDYVGSTNRFDADREPVEPMCDWDELRELSARGVSIQSHGVTHRTFTDLAASARDDELRRSKDALESALDVPVDAFAFPYGDGGDDATAVGEVLLACGYRAAYLYGGGRTRVPAPDRFRLTRIPVGPESDIAKKLFTDP
ncbi:MAG: hypothetical protein CMJ83_06630 [Planctomycetes bacterium]|nr:hypothetical protein [Planctomycetota bacterium]